MAAKGLRTGLLVGGIVCAAAGVASVVGSVLVTTRSFSAELSDFESGAASIGPSELEVAETTGLMTAGVALIVLGIVLITGWVVASIVFEAIRMRRDPAALADAVQPGGGGWTAPVPANGPGMGSGAMPAGMMAPPPPPPRP